jgi:3-deoxy-D-manno-octulosonic-acid transferase
VGQPLLFLGVGGFGGLLRIGGEPLVKREGEGEELLRGTFVVGGFDLFDVEFGAPHDRVVEAAGVVEDVAGAGAVRGDGGRGEAEVGVVVEDLLIDGLVVDGDGDDGQLGAGRVLAVEEAAVEIVVAGGGFLASVGGEELDADVVERERLVAVVGDDDADGQEAVRDVGQAEKLTVLFLLAGVGCDGDVLVGVGLVEGVLGGGLDRRRGARLVGGDGGRGQQEQDRHEFAERAHGWVDYHRKLRRTYSAAYELDGEAREAMWMTVYSFLWMLALGVSAPWWLWRMAASGRYREGLGERLGLVPERLRAAVAGKRVIWVHAVSVGEVLAVERLVAELRAALGDGWVVAISTTTTTGQKIARERLAGCPVFYYPLDFSFAVRRYLRVLRPALVVLVESEFWPRLLVECAASRIPVAVVNARVSDRSFPRYMRLRWLWKPLLGKVSLFLAQGEESAERLRAIGAPGERVRVSGNLKYDAPAPVASSNMQDLRPLLEGRIVVVAGSTHAGEEEMVLGAWPEILHAAPDAILVIAPRHPQRFAAVAKIIEGYRYPASSITSLKAEGTTELDAGEVLLLNTVGDLAAMYQFATVALIGGSLVAKGGHNPLEAARFGVPVVMGHSFENFREIVTQMESEYALLLSTAEDLALALGIALTQRDRMGKRGRAYFERQAGATKRSIQELTELIRA